MAMMAAVAPQPRPVAFRVIPEKMVSPDPTQDDVYFAHSIFYSTNGEFHFYFDKAGCKGVAAAFRTASAQLGQWKSGLWTPEQPGGPGGLIVPPGH